MILFIGLCAVLCLVAQSCPTLCDPRDCSPPGSSVHGDSAGKNTGIGCHDLQGILLTQGSNPGLPHCRSILDHLSHQGSPLLTISSVQLLSRVWLFVTPWTAAHQASIHHQLLELAQTHVHQVSDAFQPSHPLWSPSIFPSIRVLMTLNLTMNKLQQPASAQTNIKNVPLSNMISHRRTCRVWLHLTAYSKVSKTKQYTSLGHTHN